MYIFLIPSIIIKAIKKQRAQPPPQIKAQTTGLFVMFAAVIFVCWSNKYQKRKPKK